MDGRKSKAEMKDSSLVNGDLGCHLCGCYL